MGACWFLGTAFLQEVVTSVFPESKTAQQIPQEQRQAFTVSVACGYLPQDAGRFAAAQPAGHKGDAGSRVPIALTFLCYRFPPICGGPITFIWARPQTEGRSSWTPNPPVPGTCPLGSSEHPRSFPPAWGQNSQQGCET